jgi:hypothetical protein
VLIDASNNETRLSAEILEARLETTSDLEAAKKLASSFTAWYTDQRGGVKDFAVPR